MAKISVFRASDLLQGEQKWLRLCLDSRLGMALGVDVAFVSSSSDALQSPVIVALGGASRAILTGGTPVSDASCRGSIESFADRVIVTTWSLGEAIRDPKMGRDFLVDMLRARIYAYGLGNRNTGYVTSVEVSGADNATPTRFDTEHYDQVVSAFEAALGVA